MTITEKILAIHAGKKKVFPGEFIDAGVDLALGNDITAPLAIKEFEKLGINRVFNPKRIVLIPDHFVPAKDLKSAQQARLLKNFAKNYNIKFYYELGRAGVEHAFLPEQGLVKPGDLIIGADSHTCTYGALGAFATGVGSTDLAGVFATGRIWLKVPESIKFIYYGRMGRWVSGKDLILYTISKTGVDGASYCAMEFTGEVISGLEISERLTMCNMAIEAGAKNGIIAPDRITEKYLSGIKCQVPGFSRAVKYLKSDKDAKYKNIIEIDVSKIKPFVACPSLPSKGKPASELKNVKIDQVFIGSCTNGRIEDLRIAAKLLKGHRVKSGVRLIVIPGTQRVYLQALKEGLLEIFITAGGTVCTPSCGPCLGGHCGVLGPDEICIATSNRNFTGRMGDLKSKVYLASPAVAISSAIKGRITSPEEIS